MTAKKTPQEKWQEWQKNHLSPTKKIMRGKATKKRKRDQAADANKEHRQKRMAKRKRAKRRRAKSMWPRKVRPQGLRGWSY